MYEIKGFIFAEKDDKVRKAEIGPGLKVGNWDEAHALLQTIGITHYLITLKEVK